MHKRTVKQAHMYSGNVRETCSGKLDFPKPTAATQHRSRWSEWDTKLPVCQTGQTLEPT